MRIKAIFFSPIAGGLVAFTIAALFFQFDFSTDTITAIGAFSVATLIFQVLVVEPCLYLLSFFRKIDVETYFYLAIFCCYGFTFAVASIIVSDIGIFEAIYWSMRVFTFLFSYSFVNIYCYHLLYFKHKESHNEDLSNFKQS